MGPPPRSLADDAHDCIMVRMLEGNLPEHPPNTRPWRDVATRWQARLEIALTAQGCRRPLTAKTKQLEGETYDKNCA